MTIPCDTDTIFSVVNYVRRTLPWSPISEAVGTEGNLWEPIWTWWERGGNPQPVTRNPRLRNDRLAQTHESSNLTKLSNACACEEINRFQSNRTRDQPRIQRRFVPRLPPHLCMLASRSGAPGAWNRGFCVPFSFGVAAFGGQAKETGEVSFFRRLRVLNFRWLSRNTFN